MREFSIREIRCPKCNDIITEEDIVAYDGGDLITFRHCGCYWNVHIEKDTAEEKEENKMESEVIETNELPTSQCWLTFNRPIWRVTTASEDSDETV